MPRNDEYYKRYEDLCNEVGRAFCAVHILKSIGRVHDIEFDGDDYRFTIIDYLCFLAKQDLCLTVWKVYFDDDPKANTVKSLNQYLFNMGINKGVKLKLSSEANQIKGTLDSMRNQFIAHLDTHRNLSDVDVDNVQIAFFEIVEMIKGLYDNSIDDRVEPISDITISIQELKTYIGMRLIIDEFRAKKSEETENAGH